MATLLAYRARAPAIVAWQVLEGNICEPSFSQRLEALADLCWLVGVLGAGTKTESWIS